MYIANPCHEKWSAMTPTEHGRLCAQCSTVVFDMTHLSNEEILDLVKKAGAQCGRFYADQLTPPEVEKDWLMQWLGGVKKEWVAASLFLMLQLNTPAEALAELKLTEQLYAERKLSPIDSGIALPGYIQGRLSLGASSPLMNKSLYLKTKSGKKIATIRTDDRGFFAFQLPESLQEEEYVVVFKTCKSKQNRFVYITQGIKVLAKAGAWTEIETKQTRRKRIIKRHRQIVVGFF